MFSKIIKIILTAIIVILICRLTVFGQSHNLKEAKKYFNEVEKLADADGGQLWGINLMGPLVLVNDETLEAVSNYPVPVDNWKEYDGIYYGVLPENIGLANTAFDWEGQSWSMVIFSSLSEDKHDRGSLMIHELWHQHEDKFNLLSDTKTCKHLDTKDGRLLLFLEWNALLDACEKTGNARLKSLQDALHFRKSRAELYADGFIYEMANELHEGLAEYTGMTLSGRNRKEMIVYLHDRVGSHSGDNTISWTHAYTSGALYGFLLDEKSPGWNRKLCKGDDLGEVISSVYKLDYTPIDENDYVITGSLYGYDTLEKIEEERVTITKALNKSFVKRFENSPTLLLPNYGLSIQFNPSDITPFENKGNVYGRLTGQSAWGELEVTSGGILLLDGWKGLVLDVGINWNPYDSLKTNRYELKLADGYEIVETERGWRIEKSGN